MEKKEVKCVVWDLDNTIWDGVLSEDKEIKLKESIVEIIKTLDFRGILNSIASKNTYEDAIEKLDSLGISEYFLYPEINWNAKSNSIKNIQKNLNIGIDTFIFIDDQPYEREEVNSEIPEVECIDAIDYKSILNHPRLNPRFITEDSQRRRRMYQTDILRCKEESDFKGASDSFLASLNMKFTISIAQYEDLKRAEELTVRTNQLNSTGKTYSFEELDELRQSSNHKLLICELEDRFGTYGKIGLALIEIKEEAWHLKLMLMSCRVISRGVGTILISHLMQETKKANKILLADFLKTDRNKMMYVSYKFGNFKERETDDDGYILFENDLSIINPFPPYVKVTIQEEKLALNLL